MIRVAAAVIEHEGRILIARRRPGVHLAGKWEFPGGKIEPGETPEECLVRELREEFTVETEIGPFLGSAVHEYPGRVIELLAYRTRYLSGEFILSCHDEIRWITPDQCRDFDFAEADLFILEHLERLAPNPGFY